MATGPVLARPHTVTFDCWSTLIHEAGTNHGVSKRARMLANAAGVAEGEARAALGAAWRHHQIQWHSRVAFTAHDMTAHALAALGASLDGPRLADLVTALEDEALKSEIRVLPGARETLERLRRANVRRALICDTGFSPGRVVRRLLDRVGLLEHLEVTVFSDEIGVPKPHPRAFTKALEALSVSREGAVHIGDLRRSDVAGAMASGMGTIRITAHHDDSDDAPRSGAGIIDCSTAGCEPVCERPEAHVIAATYADIDEMFGFG
jgi:FMN phosphatase YigB (HAD superfamily)